MAKEFDKDILQQMADYIEMVREMKDDSVNDSTIEMIRDALEERLGATASAENVRSIYNEFRANGMTKTDCMRGRTEMLSSLDEMLQELDFKNDKKMTKAEIASEIAKTTGIDKAAVVTVIEQFMTVVKDSLAHGENVYLRGFGSFIIKHRAEKTARNITKNTTITIAAHDLPCFKPAKAFVDQMKGESE